MIQLELYLKEMTNFLRTLTIKNTFFADHMVDVWVKDKYKKVVQDFPYLHPYYRNITGEYILFDYSDLEKAYGIYADRYDSKEEYLAKQAEIIDMAENTYGLSRTSLVPCLDYESRKASDITYAQVPNSSIYNYCNELPIINSFDTQKKIPFTKAILTSTDEINTAEIYKIPNERYFKLLEKYPTSADIIKAIVYPITEKTVDQVKYSPLDVALNGKNFELLAYDSSQLETCEFESMYECVTNTLDMVRRRYAVKEFCYEDLYPQGMEYLLWNILYFSLFVQRIANIRTGNVHSYHLWAYLKSHGFGEYRDILTTRQQNFLYRNLPYLLEHKGTQHALEILIYVLLTTQNISLQGKNTIQMTDDVNNVTGTDKIENTARKSPAMQSITVGKPMLTAIANMYKETPDLRFQKVLDYMGLHAGENSENDQQEYEAGYNETTETIYKKEKEAGLEYQDDYNYGKSKERCDYLISTSQESYRNTKLLELINSSSSNIYVNLYTKFFAETLMYRISTGDMKFSISFVPPDSATKIVLPAEDAVGMIFYALNKANKNIMPSMYPDYGVPLYDTGQATTQFTGEPERIWTHGQRVYTRWKLMNKPPSRYRVEWPYRVEFDGKEQDFPEISETVLWRQYPYYSFGMLKSIVTTYSFTIDSRTILFHIADVSSEESTRKYISETVYELTKDEVIDGSTDYYTRTGSGTKDSPYVYTKATDVYDGMPVPANTYYVVTDIHYVIEYYSSKGIWVMHDANNIIHYFTEKPDYFTVNLEKLQWYDKNEEPVDLSITIFDSKKVLDLNMNNYHGVFHNVTDFSAKAHAQAMDFINMYIENTRDGDLIYHEMFRQIMKERFVDEEVSVNLLNGMTFTDYLEQDDENIVALKAVFDSYDLAVSSELSYSNFADTVIKALMPIDEALLSSNATVMTDKYKKIVKLFKSMLAYNLAFISSEYKNVDSTIFEMTKHAPHKQYWLEKATDVTRFDDNCQDHHFELFKPDFFGQTKSLWWEKEDLRENDTETEDNLVAKQCIILNNIDDVCTILDSKLTDKTKKAKLKKLLGSIFLANYIMNKSFEDILIIQDTNKKVSRETPIDVVQDIDTEDHLYDEDITEFGGRVPTAKEIEEFEKIIKELLNV